MTEEQEQLIKKVFIEVYKEEYEKFIEDALKILNGPPDES